MFTIADRKISAKLSFLTLVPAVAFIIFTGWAMLTIYSFTDMQSEIYQAGESVRIISTDLIHPLNQLRESSMSIVMAPDENFRKGVSDKFTQTMQQIETNIEMIDNSENFRTAAANINNMKQMWKQYRKLSELTRNYIEKGYREAAFINASTAERDQFGALTEALVQWQKQATEKAMETYKEGKQKGRNSMLFTVFIGCTALFIIIFLSSGIKKLLGAEPSELSDITKQIASGNLDFPFKDKAKQATGVYLDMKKMVRSLKRKAGAAERIAAGDLLVEIKADSDKDILGRSFEKMILNLNTLIGSVHRASVQVAEGTGQISSATASLSQGASEQAASFEQITSSMVEIASQTRSNADNAAHAVSLANQSRESAENGMKEMRDMILAMNEISDASKSVAKIIKNIDEIAFQTNLLSLNAAVEAARAGRHGKGFAVVAGEVRSLAGRSAKAAKETAELIEKTVSRIEKGNHLAVRTEQSFVKITESVADVSDIISEIAAASDEQANGISQINEGLNQTDQVTQQNTAHAEEIASSAADLSARADDLRKLLAQFRTDRGKKLDKGDISESSYPDSYTDIVKSETFPKEKASSRPLRIFDDGDFSDY